MFPTEIFKKKKIITRIRENIIYQSIASTNYLKFNDVYSSLMILDKLIVFYIKTVFMLNKQIKYTCMKQGFVAC